ncbi:MAG: CehA/McbA family metallohydrolase [Phycisphaerae bacterium]|nr:CehA/McbA family metallohydrolase [Phycisphaerae bacterium]
MAHDFLIPMTGSQSCTRRHAIKVLAAGVGGILLGAKLPRAMADLPWAEIPPATPLGPDDLPLTICDGQSYGNAGRQAAPTLALGPDGKTLWTSWAELNRERETICLRSLSMTDGKWSDALLVSEAGQNAATYESETVVVGQRLVVVWSQWEGDGWSLYARGFDPASGMLGTPQLLAGGAGKHEIHIHPAIAATDKRALVVWQTKPAGVGQSFTYGQLLDSGGTPIGDHLSIGVYEGRDCCRPAVAAAPDGTRFAVAFERQDSPGTQNIYVTEVSANDGDVAGLQQVTRHPASDLAPAVAYSPDGGWLWVAWQSNRRGDDGWDITPWYRLAGLRISDNTWHAPELTVAPRDTNDHGTVQGFELVRLAISPTGVVCVLGRASHNFYVQYHTSEGCSELYRLPKDGWGGRGRLMYGVFDADSHLWVARRDLSTNMLHRVSGFEGLSGPPDVQPYAEATTTTAPAILSGKSPRHEWPEPTGPTNGFKPYFGDIHGHSWQSDGMGDPERSYMRARDIFRDNFHVLTDHDFFVGKRLNDAQWQEQKDVVEHYHAPGEFVTLFGQEWTTPRTNLKHGWGHFNIYTADPTIPMFDHKDERWRDLPDLYNAIRKYNAIAIPHHIGWTGAPWDQIDLQLTPVTEICSVHGAFEYEGNTPIRHRGGMSGCFYRDGLAKGLRIGVAGGTDQHGLTWHHGVCWKRNAFRAGLTGIWAPELSREAVLNAFRARRTFATTGVKMQLYVTVNNELMGGVAKLDGPPKINVDVAVAPDKGNLAWLEIVRDGVVINRFGGEAQRSRYTFTDENCPLLHRAVANNECSYYLRVVLANDNMAWSSPVWVTRA